MYTPFGEKLNNPSANYDDTGFTGHIEDAASGLTYMQARYYDPRLGRFLSNDPVGFSEGGPAYFNRYMYVANDPINMTDPTGEFGVFGAAVGAAIGGAVSYGAQVYKDVKGGASLREAATSTAALKAGATGALTGALVGSGAGLVTSTVGAALIGGGVEAAAGAITGEGATAAEIGAAAFNNAVATGGGVGVGKIAEKAAGFAATVVRNKGAALAVRSGQISPKEAVSTISSPGIDVSGTVIGEVAGHAGGAAVTIGATEKPPSEIVVDKFEEIRQ